MPDFSDARAFVMDGEITVADDSPLHRARVISRLIDEEALASERLGRFTDRVAAALLEANLCSIRVPQADGGLGGTGVDLFKVTEEICRADGSAGWCMGICNAVNTFVHKGAPPKACQEAFGNGPVGC